MLRKSAIVLVNQCQVLNLLQYLKASTKRLQYWIIQVPLAPSLIYMKYTNMIKQITHGIGKLAFLIWRRTLILSIKSIEIKYSINTKFI